MMSSGVHTHKKWNAATQADIFQHSSTVLQCGLAILLQHPARGWHSLRAVTPCSARGGRAHGIGGWGEKWDEERSSLHCSKREEREREREKMGERMENESKNLAAVVSTVSGCRLLNDLHAEISAQTCRMHTKRERRLRASAPSFPANRITRPHPLLLTCFPCTCSVR